MPTGRTVVGGLIFLLGLALIALSLWYATYESYEFGRLPYLIIGSISAAAGLALAGSGVLVVRGGRRVGYRALVVIGLVVVAVIFVSTSGLLPFAVIPIAAALFVVTRSLLASDVSGRTA